MSRFIIKRMRSIWKSKGSVLLVWCISYIIVLLIPLIFGVVIYSITSGVIEREVYRSNSYMLELIRERADGIANEILRMNAEISFDADVEALRKKEFTENDRLILATNVKTKLNQYSQENKSIDELYIYLKKSDTVVSTVSCGDSDTFFDVAVKNGTLDYRAWLSLMNEYHKGDYVPLTRTLQNGRAEPVIAFMKTLPAKHTMYDTSVTATIVILVDQKKFFSVLSDNARALGSNIHILDRNKNIIMTSAQGLAVDWKSIMDGNTAVKKVKIDGISYMTSYIESKENALTYIVTSPLKAFEKTNSYVRLYTGISMILSLLFGGVTIWVLLKKNYDPVKSLLESLHAVHGNYAKEKNEFSYINRIIQSITEKQEEVDRKLSKQDKMLKNIFVENYLMRNFANQLTEAEFLERTGYVFPYQKFRVLIFYIDDYEQLFSDDKIDAERRLQLAKLIVGNISEELLRNYGTVYINETESQMVGILNMEQDFLIEIKKCLENIQNIVYFNFDFTFTVSIGNVYDTIDSLQISYREAVQCLKYGIFAHEDGIIAYEEIQVSKEYDYSLEKEMQLISFIKAGDSDSVIKMLQQIYSEKAENPYLSKLLLFDLMGTVMKLFNEIDDGSDGGNEVKAKGNLLLQCFDRDIALPDIYEAIRAIIVDICGKFAECSQENRGLAGQLQQYIEENYADPNLTIAGLGTVFDKTPSYLSRLFKQQVGCGLLEYINQYRIIKAKQLLVTENQTLRQIAAAVGFENDKTFTRLFKKYTGTVPSKWKA